MFAAANGRLSFAPQPGHGRSHSSNPKTEPGARPAEPREADEPAEPREADEPAEPREADEPAEPREADEPAEPREADESEE
ncbi:MAG TPA: hypothetical protein VFK05_01005 [Polyangiaceae bacterium]|nr:hypothetical protein [Polyangiaceae bacterium]